MLSNLGPQTKIGRAIEILLIPRFWSGSTKNVVSFFVLVRGNIVLHNLKAYSYAFILSHGSKFLGEPFMVKTWFWVNFKSFFVFKAIIGHEEGTQKFRAVAQNKTI